MQSRRLEDVTARYPELAGIAEALAGRGAVLDGEVVALDDGGRPSFQLLQRRMGLTDGGGRAARAMADTPVDYIAFDLLHLDGAHPRPPLRRAPRAAHGLELDGPRWRVPAPSRRRGHELLEAARRQGLEGVVAKRLDSPYRPGRRSGEWIKARVWRRQEFVIGGHIPGEGSRAGRVGSLLVGYYDQRASELGGEGQRLIFACGVGSGPEARRTSTCSPPSWAAPAPRQPVRRRWPRGPKARLAVWCEPELVCEVSWTEWTEEGTLRQPTFKGMRDDKDPREVVRES